MTKHEKTLELDKILKLLSEQAAGGDAAELCFSLSPAKTFSEAAGLLKQTEDAHIMIARYGSPGFSSLYNMDNALTRAAAGGVLSMLELLRLGHMLRTFRTLSDWHVNHGLKTVLDGFFDGVVPNKYLEQKILDTVLSEDEIADHASDELYNIRRKIKASANKIKESLDKMIRSATVQKYLQDSIVTMRSGRYVVPVKNEYRYEVAGLVHDTSSSGATVFIEPMSVVETNNEIKLLQAKEKDEIERVLAELSAETGGFSQQIKFSYENAIELNIIFAKASLGYRMKAVIPAINEDGRTVLNKARHPLIDNAKVVPVDIILGGEFDSLIITGPNTGGKTVTLKTIGLLSLMAACGLMIPAAENSEIAFYTKVLADIGDEQSIEQSLSTFSSHMTNIVDIMTKADKNSLVLLDELGAGTDPIEGAALAVSILEKLRKTGCRLAATTHYAELKAYAIETEGVKNASCEFDVKTLKPTYKLLIGIPGRSNAFAISERLGMDNSVIDRAKTLVSTDNKRFETVVDTLLTSQKELEQQKEKAYFSRKKADEMERVAKQAMAEAEEKYKKEIENARESARKIIDDAKAQANRLIDELEQLKKSDSNAGDKLSATRSAMKKGIKTLEANAIIEKKDISNYKLPRSLMVGDTVLIADLDKKAVVLTLPDNKGIVQVRVGIINTKVYIKQLRLIEEGDSAKSFSAKNAQSSINRSAVSSNMERSGMQELDIRGLNVMEAEIEIDRFIDTAMLSNMEKFTIIHGKGTGQLRTGVQAYLKSHTQVKSQRPGVFGEGEMGVTVVELK